MWPLGKHTLLTLQVTSRERGAGRIVNSRRAGSVLVVFTSILTSCVYFAIFYQEKNKPCGALWWK